ncbi:MAG: hypothetical protein QXS54_03105 [Candidatus Methanomethylicaceae archaeon]
MSKFLTQQHTIQISGGDFTLNGNNASITRNGRITVVEADGKKQCFYGDVFLLIRDATIEIGLQDAVEIGGARDVGAKRT